MLGYISIFKEINYFTINNLVFKMQLLLTMQYYNFLINFMTLNNNKFTIGVFILLYKIFDTVDQEILLEKL